MKVLAFAASLRKDSFNRKLIQSIQESQAVLISTPEYNGGIPGLLKNAGQAFDERGLLIDPKKNARLEELTRSFLECAITLS